MARHWKEELDPSKHRDFMRGYQDAGGVAVDTPKDNLLEAWVYFVQVAGVTFQFVSTDQICEALRYFEKKVQPSSREYNNGLERFWQPWFCRLPPGIRSEAKRIKVVKALKAALTEYGPRACIPAQPRQSVAHINVDRSLHQTPHGAAPSASWLQAE
jgi:hypothetical protein